MEAGVLMRLLPGSVKREQVLEHGKTKGSAGKRSGTNQIKWLKTCES